MLTHVEIKKSAIKHNLGQIRRTIGPKVKLMAIIKSNAYGHGMVETARIVIKTGADWLGVISDNEALELRQAKIKSPIFILSYWDQEELESTIKKIYDCDFPVYTLSQAILLSRLGRKIKKIINIHVKIDTGTSRIGVNPQEAISFIKKVKKLSYLNLRGIFTHYAASEDKNQNFTNQQSKKFNTLIQELKNEKIFISFRHAACSAATIINPSTHFNLVRVGIATYGLWPSSDTKVLIQRKNKRFSLQPALTWKTKIIQIKDILPGSSIGYDRTYKVKQRIKLAILPIGYWDGYDRHLSGQGEALIAGQRCPVRGRICMNLTMVDVSKLKKVKVGDEVILLGQQGKQEITAEELADRIGTINYEVVTRINPLIIRKYV